MRGPQVFNLKTAVQLLLLGSRFMVDARRPPPQQQPSDSAKDQSFFQIISGTRLSTDAFDLLSGQIDPARETFRLVVERMHIFHYDLQPASCFNHASRRSRLTGSSARWALCSPSCRRILRSPSGRSKGSGSIANSLFCYFAWHYRLIIATFPLCHYVVKALRFRIGDSYYH
jgi:hypothetical protein